MADIGSEKTEKLIDTIEQRLNCIYSQAAKETKEKYLAYVEKFKKQEAKKLEDLAKGKITQSQFDEWRQRAMFSGKQYQALAETMAKDLTMVNQKAMSIVNGYTPEAYALNRNYAFYQLDLGGVDVAATFTLYDRHTVEKLARGKASLLPKPKVDIPKDQRWNRQHIRNAIAQGVLQGESIPDIAKRLEKVVGMNHSSAVRNARTAMTGAQNAGRVSSYRDARKLGIKVLNEWLATNDSRTRDSHAKINGDRVPDGKKFANGCEYPGDPNGPPEEVYNCRCTLIPYLPDYDFDEDDVSEEGFEKWSKSRKFNADDFSYAVTTANMSEAEVRKAWRDLCPELTSEQEFIQDVYVATDDSFRINSAFRQAGENIEGKSVYDILEEYGGFPRWMTGTREEFAARVEGFDKLIADHALKKDTLLTRLVSDRYSESVLGLAQGTLESVIYNFDTEAVQEALGKLVGTKVTEYGFMSTAGALDERFQAFSRRNVVLKLFAKEGTPALYANPDELEVVLGRGTKYTILGFEKETQDRPGGRTIDRLVVKCLVGG